MKKRINKILDMLQEAHGLLVELIEEREAIFDEKTERWQEGDKGTEYQELTDQLEELEYNLERAEEVRS